MKEKEEFPGYRGKVLAAVRKVEAEVGDRIRVTKDGQVYEGLLIPRSEYGDEEHIVVKLNTGYNIGIRITPETKIEKIGKGAKPAFTPPVSPEKKPKLPKVGIISTGGTIASRVDYRTGAVRPALKAGELYSVVPELADIAQIDAKILFSLYSENIAPPHWTQMAEAVARHITQDVDGVVIAHGTDTMGYTAAALSFALQNLPVPVVVVGSQRSADRPSSDAATNLIGAVTAAGKAPFAEVCLAMHETISDTAITLHRGTKTRKCHTSRRDAFQSVNDTPLGRVENQKIEMLTNRYRPRDPKRELKLRTKFNEKVALIKFYPAMNPKIIDWYVEKGYQGIILEGTGLGHVASYTFESLKNAIQQQVIVGMTSQCLWGRINMNVYNQGRDLLSIGVIPLEDILPETAVVKLMWVLGQTQELEEAEELLRRNIAGEFTSRTLP
ncbi:MAG: Glu-tRNA(Gln) amidotransferase subunit GatD [Thermoproteota archaeon]